MFSRSPAPSGESKVPHASWIPGLEFFFFPVSGVQGSQNFVCFQDSWVGVLCSVSWLRVQGSKDYFEDLFCFQDSGFRV